MVRLTDTIIFCRYNRKGTSHSSTWWLQRVGSYVAEWAGATTHVWPNDEQFDPQEFDAYLQRYTAATRVRLIQPTDPAEAPPASMHDMYPIQSTAGSRQHAVRITFYSTIILVFYLLGSTIYMLPSFFRVS
jgi:hypothetical protein